MSALILTEPFITRHPTLADNWIVIEKHLYIGYGVKVEIPKGFVTDLASIPRPLWPIIAPFELSIEAPIVHDWLYRHGGGGRLDYGPNLTRAQVDQLFYNIMDDEGVWWWRRQLGYSGVRVGGGLAWNSGKVLIEQFEV